mmetsp:Transcript_27232/g.109041  ORF Transcript_27232/g.109041 Transcript_27232/m.109041 type:complete len:201 (+) Transcript_27232:72-674(+)
MTRPPRGLRQPDTTPWTPPPQALRRRAARAGGVALDSIDARMLATGRVRHVSSGATDRDARAHPPLVTVTIVGLLVQGADVALDKGPAGARHGRQRRAGGRDDDADGDDGDDGGASVALVEVAPGAPELRELPPATLVLDAAPARAPDDDGAFAVRRRAAWQGPQTLPMSHHAWNTRRQSEGSRLVLQGKRGGGCHNKSD